MVRSRGRAGWLREPLLHFLLIGLALYAASQWAGGGGAQRIVVSPGRIEALAAAFSRTWQRPPTESELKGLIDDYVREEIATREALAMGLDRDDTIIRRRLRQKLEFLLEDTVDASPPTQADLSAWLEQHPESFRVADRIAFRHVYLSPEKRRDAAADAKDLLAELALLDGDADTSGLGDPILLPGAVPLSSPAAIAREFGDAFAQRVSELEPGRWRGPVESAYGFHLVFVERREEGYLPDLADVRPAVEREWGAQRRQQQLQAMYERLLERYDVLIELPEEAG